VSSLVHFIDSLFPAEYRIFAVILSAALLGLTLAAISPKAGRQRPNFILGAIVIFAVMLLLWSSPSARWHWMVVLIPSLIITHHAIFVWISKPKEKEPGTLGRRRPHEMSVSRARSAIESYYSFRTLFVRYGLPAILLLIAGITIINLLVEPKGHFSLLGWPPQADDFLAANYISSRNVELILRGARFGAAGAYLFVLVDLGRRTFRHDVTSGSAMWCLVTLLVGPILASVIALVWRVKGADDAEWWEGGVVLFAAGLAPRRLLTALEMAARQFLKIGPEATVVESRLVPLGRLRGIAPQIEERLSEEGVLDVSGLASADPVRLVRNTSFDMHQIVSWIDEAILVITLPRHWQALEESGITGAIDLAWYQAEIDQTAPAVPDEVKQLAEAVKIDPTTLVSVIRRLYEDAHVQQVWALYYAFDEHSDDEPPEVELPIARSGADS
jgi:hypothetical protein